MLMWFLASGGGVGADRGEVLGAGEGAEAAGDLLPDFGHTDVAFGEVDPAATRPSQNPAVDRNKSACTGDSPNITTHPESDVPASYHHSPANINKIRDRHAAKAPAS